MAGENSIVRPSVVAFTDGSSLSQIYGGWSVVIGGKVVASGSDFATSNYMEMTAILNAVAIVPDHTDLTIYTDSELCIGWLAKGWRARIEKIAEIRTAINMLKEAKDVHVTLRKVKGHSTSYGNHLADEAAQRAAQILRNGG